MMERTFDTELAELNELILKMGNMAERAIFDSVGALKGKDKVLSEKVILDDREIDRLENEIDDKCITLLATRQPMANDLRFITTAMKVTTDLERIGDLAVDIAQKNLEIISSPLLKPLIDTPKLADIAQKMIRMSLDSFIKRDSEGLSTINDLEKEADRLRDLITDELMDIMSRDPGAVTRAVPLMLVARHLERICDHAMNIAEDVVYMVDAKVEKHMHQKIKVLFVCVHNSARSQMAEAFTNLFGKGEIIAESAGLEPGKLNPFVVEVMKEKGIDISNNITKSVFDFYRSGKKYNYVVTVCDGASGEKCPIFPGVNERLHWSFEDPSSFKGSREEILERTRQVRDKIEEKVSEWTKGLI